MTRFQSLPFAHGTPPACGRLRVTDADFQVDEDLGFEPSGAGEHVLLRLRKCDANTEWVAKRLCAYAGVRPVAVSYAGLKDRHAITSQWFSVQLPGREEPDWSALNDDHLQVLTAARHHRKLRRGTLRGNRFQLRVRQVQGDRASIEARLALLAEQGVPAYFGTQRFGRDGDNVDRALAMFAGSRVSRHQRSLLLSAARSWLFNQVLSRRVHRGDWNRLIPGDLAMLDGSHSVFAVAAPDATLQQRCAALDLHPSGPLHGRGGPEPDAEALELERGVMAAEPVLCEGLVRAGVDAQRRALRHAVRDLTWQWLDQDTLQVSFFLDRGNYATSVMRELVTDPDAPLTDA